MNTKNHSNIAKISKSIIITMLFSIILFAFPPRHYSYDADTHFWLTYYLAVKAGYSQRQATKIASANISVDLDQDTNPVFAEINRIGEVIRPWTHVQTVRTMLHALPRRKIVIQRAGKEKYYWWSPLKVTDAEIQRTADAMIAERKAEFWSEVVREGKNLGVFLHYLQDSYAHRGFLSYIGHAGYSYVDFLGTDCDKAQIMVEDTLKYLIAFRKNVNVETVNIKSYLSENDLTEIKNTVTKFCDANPNPLPVKDIKPNELITAWESMSENKRRNYHRRMPIEFVLALRSIMANNPATDTCKAREIVKDILNYSENDLPDIWQYNLNKKGKAIADTTYLALRYSPPSGEGCHYSEDVKPIERTPQPVDKKLSNVPCLTFSLEENSLEDKTSVCVLKR